MNRALDEYILRQMCFKSEIVDEIARLHEDSAYVVAPIAQLVKGRLSDAGGLRFESQAGRVTGKSIPSLWRDKHPAIKGLRPPEHHAGKFHPDHKKIPPNQAKTKMRTQRTPSSASPPAPRTRRSRRLGGIQRGV